MSNMVIATNVLALNSHRQLKGIGGEISKSSERLSSGYRINRAADDAAGLAISEKMRSQIRGLDQASRNSQDGISLIQTTEGALQETENMLQRMRELVVQASNDTLTDSDRNKIGLELDELIDEIDSTASKTEFNTKKLIDGSWKNSEIYLQTGANKSQGLSFNIAQMDASALGVTKGEITTIINGGVDVTSLGTGIVDITAANYKNFVGTYMFGDGASFTVNDDGTMTVKNMYVSGAAGGSNNKFVKSETYLLSDMVAASLFAANDNTATNSKVVFALGLATFTGKTTETAESSDDGVKTDTTFGTITQVTAGVPLNTDKFTFNAGTKLLNAKGEAVDFEIGKVYLGSDLNSLGVAAIIDNQGNRYKLATGVIESGTSLITFAAGSTTAEGSVADMAAVGQADGKTISKLTTAIDAAIEKVSSQRAQLGAYQNRLEHTIKNLDTSSENLSASESRIRDTDMAKEMMSLTKNNVLNQAATAMLAQANQAPQSILKLLS